MRKKIYFSYNEKKSSTSRNIIFKKNLTEGNNIPKEEENERILFNHKSSLVLLLNSIKNFQNDIFSINESNKINSTKKLLILLQNNLTSMKSEKTKKYEFLKNKNEDIKKRIKDIIFQETQTNVDNKEFSVSYVKEKNELELLNFQIENEIKKTQILFEQKNKIYKYLKSIPFFLGLYQEKYCRINKENTEIISDILKNIRTLVKTEFISSVKEKLSRNIEINNLTYQINSIKEKGNKYGNEKYIDQEEIIYEETKENNRTLISAQSKRNSYASNKIATNKKKLSRPSISLNKKHFSIDSEMNNFYINKLLELIQNNGENINNNKNQINNYLNINVNINLNSRGYKQYSSSESEEENELKAENEFKGEDSLIESEIQEEDIKNENDD